MRWEKGRRSSNIEDRRGGVPKGKLALGLGGTVILVVVGLLLGADPEQILNVAVENQRRAGSAANGGAVVERPEAENRAADFVSVVLADTEDVWTELFAKEGKTYKEPKLVLFTDRVDSACGRTSASVGPFYCPPDQKVYIDLGFFDDLASKHGAAGDFAQAYVVGHEIGHHIQTLRGTSSKVHRARSGISKEEGNQLSVLLELQADCYSGVWAHHADKARNVLEKGDVDEALRAAAAIGDDRLQKKARGYVTPESFTHGTSAQRAKWFRVGLEHGSIQKCDTFDGRM